MMMLWLSLEVIKCNETVTINEQSGQIWSIEDLDNFILAYIVNVYFRIALANIRLGGMDRCIQMEEKRTERLQNLGGCLNALQ